MSLINFCWLLLLPAVLMYEQSDFHLKYERAELVRFNHTHVGSAVLKNFKYNRTQACTNSTYMFKTAFENELQVEVQAYRFASNEYREFPVRFAFDFCKWAKKNEFGMRDLFKCGNITGCPLKKGIYRSCNWHPNANRFPPLIPEGSYMLDLKVFYRSIEVWFMQTYGTVTYPFF